MYNFVDLPDRPNIIELRDVSQSYDGGESWIIKDLKLLIEDKPNQGQFVVILGMSGSGKSTLLRYIAGLQQPTSGTVLINEKEANEKDRVSMVFQQYSSLPWMTVLDNVGLALRYQGVGKKERDAKSRELIEMVGLKGQELKYAQYPGLSGGQLQRVAIARSLIANPSLLLMDEPFGALDVRTRVSMQDMLTSIWRKFQSTIVFVTHDISEAVYLADDIYILGHRPSQIVQHFSVNLPVERNRTIKRSPEYIKLVHDIEDAMIEIGELG